MLQKVNENGFVIYLSIILPELDNINNVLILLEEITAMNFEDISDEMMDIMTPILDFIRKAIEFWDHFSPYTQTQATDLANISFPVRSPPKHRRRMSVAEISSQRSNNQSPRLVSTRNAETPRAKVTSNSPRVTVNKRVFSKPSGPLPTTPVKSRAIQIETARDVKFGATPRTAREKLTADKSSKVVTPKSRKYPIIPKEITASPSCLVKVTQKIRLSTKVGNRAYEESQATFSNASSKVSLTTRKTQHSRTHSQGKHQNHNILSSLIKVKS